MSKKSLLLSFAIISLLLSACATDNVKTSKKTSGDIYYVKDNSYYVTKKDGTRYVLSEDDIEYNAAYTKRKNKEIVESSGGFDFGMIFGELSLGFETKTQSIEERYKNKNYSPINYYDFKNNRSIVEIDYNNGTKTFTYKISTDSIISKDIVKKSIDNEKEYLVEETTEETIVDAGFNDLFGDIFPEEFNQIGNNENNGIENESLYQEDDYMMEATPSEIIAAEATESEIPTEEEKIDRIYSLKEGEYYHDVKNNSIYYLNVNDFNVYNYVKQKKELIDTDVIRIKMYGENIVYLKNNKVVFYNIKKGIVSSFDFDTEKLYNAYFKKDDHNNIYISIYDEILKLYLVNKKDGVKLIDENIDKIFGLTKNRIFYSKPNIITLPYKDILIDDVSTGEFMGEEPILKNYRLNDDPMSFEFDIEKYTADRFSYKIKEKYYNDRKNYINRYVEGIKNGSEEIMTKSLISSDGTNNEVINADGIVNFYILDEDKDVIYFETDLSLDIIPIDKKHLSEFVVSSYTVDSFITSIIDNRKKKFSHYVDKAGVVYHINDLDLYRKYIERESKLLYDAEYNRLLSELEKRDIYYENDKIFLSGIASGADSKSAYVFTLEKTKEIFADSINIKGYKDIHFVGFIDNPVYLLEDENNTSVLKLGIKELSKNVYLGSVVINDKKTSIAYVVNNSNDDINYNGELHKVNVKNNDEDTIISEKAFAYNVVFDSDTGDLLYLLNYSAEEDMGTLICVDTNNKKYFIDDKVLYVLKY